MVDADDNLVGAIVLQLRIHGFAVVGEPGAAGFQLPVNAR